MTGPGRIRPGPFHGRRSPRICSRPSSIPSTTRVLLGVADLSLDGDQIAADIASEGLAPNHQNGDNLVNTTEGEPSYGLILTSFTTGDDTSPESGLAVDRFPVANEDGTLAYDRTFGVPINVAERLGEFAVVHHGVDLNGNGCTIKKSGGTG